VFDEVNVDEHPALTNLRSRNLAGARLLLQRDRMDVQKRRSAVEIERVHGGLSDLRGNAITNC
jgi:hypothetical protein